MVAFMPDSLTLNTVAAVSLVFTCVFQSFPCWLLTILCCCGVLAAEAAKERMTEFQSAMTECEKAAAKLAAAATAVRSAPAPLAVEEEHTAAAVPAAVKVPSITDLSSIGDRLNDYVFVEAPSTA